MFLIFISLFSCAKFAERAPADKKSDRHIVFDIDWTIVSEIKNPNAKNLKNKRVIEVEGIHYYVSDGLEEFIEDILSHKEMKISFYSGGPESRNLALLSKIKLKNGKSLLDLAFKVLSRSDLVEIPDVPAGAKFADRYRKDLTKISLQLDELIMFDDTANFVIENSDNQSDHVFFIGKAFEYFETFADTRGKSGEYVPHSFEQWLLQRNRMFILNGVFNEAYLESVNSGIPLSESLKKRELLLNLKSHEWNKYSEQQFKNRHKKTMLSAKEPALDCHMSMELFLKN